MATNKHALIRYEALDRCFSNKGKRFFMDDLIAYVSEVVSEYVGSETADLYGYGFYEVGDGV